MSEKDQGGDRLRHGNSGFVAGLMIVVYVILASFALLTVWVSVPRSGSSLWRELARGCALLGFSLIALQFVLAGRFRAIDRYYGLDIVMRFHKVMGATGLGLLILHPVFLLVDNGNLSLLALDVPWQVGLGKLALLLLVLTVAAAMLATKLPIDYQLWRASHKVVIVIAALGLLHGLLVGSDLREPAVRTLVVAVGVAVVLVFLYRNLYVPLWGRVRMKVGEVVQETHDTYTIRLEPESGRGLRHLPGQFWFVKLVRPGRPSEEHPFTISSSPTGEPPLTSTIKESGNYTNTIGRTRKGDRALVEGPYGRFSYLLRDAPALLFIAGGVGITPLMSMLRHLRDSQDARPVVLLYGNQKEQDIIFREELEAMPPNVTVTHVLSSPPEGWQGPSGYVTGDVIRQHAGEVLDRADVYICGPPPMMDALVPVLGDLGIPDDRIRFERFSL